MKDVSLRIGDKLFAVSSISECGYLDSMGGVFERDMVALFRALIAKDDVVADIGANIGLTALFFSSLAKKVYAFEPSPSTYRMLSENLARNSIGNVDAVNLGLGQKEETLTITFSSNFRAGAFVSDKIRPGGGHITEPIRIDTLDHFFGEKDPAPTFLKIDVEGFEQNVIRGAGVFLQKNRPTVVMEMNHGCLNVCQRIALPDFLDFMRSVFPHLYAVDSDNATIVDLHIPDQAYVVMQQHCVLFRFPNLVGGFDPDLKSKLDALASEAKAIKSRQAYQTPALPNPDGNIVALSTVSGIQVGAFFGVTVKISNESREVWHGYGSHPVRLSYHWKKPDGTVLVFDGVRTELATPDLQPGQSVEQTMDVRAPQDIGEFQLVLTLLQEGVCWFEEKGFQAKTLTVTVGNE